MPDKEFSLDDILAEYDRNSKSSDIDKSDSILSSINLNDQKINSEAPVPDFIPEKKAEPSIEVGQEDITEPASPVKQSVRTHNDDGRIRSDSPLKLKLEQYTFLFKQLVKRDFKGRYKRAALGVLWSMLSPMFSFAAQAIIFTFLFNRRGEHFISYLVIGNVVFHYFTDAANSGMFSLASNGGIISKINVPKSMFLLSKNVSCLFNFLLTMIIMFVISAIDGVHFSCAYFTLIYPMITMTMFNIGVGCVLSAWFVFFKDTQYLFSIFCQILMYFSAIFYRIESFPDIMQKIFYLNPVYCYIFYFRSVIIDNVIPSGRIHFVCLCYAALAVFAGIGIYKKNNNKFVYYF